MVLIWLHYIALLTNDVRHPFTPFNLEITRALQLVVKLTVL